MRARLAVTAAASALLVAVGSAAAVEPPRTPAGLQLDWVIQALNRASVPSNAELARHFSAAFLKAVPPARLVEALSSVSAERPLRVAEVLARQGQLGLQVRVETRSGASFRVTITVAAAAPHPIEGLLFQPLAAPLASWSAVDAALRGLAAHAGLYAGRADGGALHALAASRAGAIGSAFKLYVLGALAQAVKDGSAAWDEPLAIRDAWKSLPSGDMRTEPAGKRFTLRHFAEQMISVSDNTAADHLIGRLGRPAVERQLAALGDHAAARSEPFLTTREFFALKLAAPASLREAFARAGTAERRRLLAGVDALQPTLAEAATWTAPRSIDRIEWFASPADLAHAIAALVDRAREPALEPVRAILAINPGVPVDHSAWRYVGFKGGSEPGVLSMTWYLERHDGRAFVLSIVLNDDRRGIDTAAALSAAEAAIGLLARA